MLKQNQNQRFATAIWARHNGVLCRNYQSAITIKATYPKLTAILYNINNHDAAMMVSN